MAKSKSPKKRQKKYEDKLFIEGTLDDVLKVSIEQAEGKEKSKKKKGK